MDTVTSSEGRLGVEEQHIIWPSKSQEVETNWFVGSPCWLILPKETWCRQLSDSPAAVVVCSGMVGHCSCTCSGTGISWLLAADTC
jgi:hypothetical protein